MFIYCKIKFIRIFFYFQQDWAVKNWLAKGTPKEKLILGLATYGRSFTLSSSDTGMGSPAKGGGSAGSFTKEKGFLSYYEVSAI